MSREATIEALTLDGFPQPLKGYWVETDKANRALSTFKRAFAVEPLRSSPVARILDFGCGSGDPTMTLTVIGRAIGAEVFANDLDDEGIWLARRGILPEDHFIPGDGIKHLIKVGEEGSAKYDLIVGYWFGPDRWGSLFRLLAISAIHSLNSTGNILLSSDPNTMSGITNRCKDAGMAYSTIEEYPQHSIPLTIVVPQIECPKMLSQWC